MRQHFVVLGLLLMLSACSRAPTGYFPTEKGLSWQYAVTVTTMDLVKNSKYLVRNVGVDRLADRTVFVQETHNGAQSLYAISDEGVKRVGIRHKIDTRTQFEQQDHFLLRYPLQQGTRWKQMSSTAVLEVVIAPFRRHYTLQTPVKMFYEIQELLDSVSVKAGSFEHCIRVRGTGKTRVDADKSLGSLNIEVMHDDWYCRGVGLVKSQRTEKTDSTVLVQGRFEMELERFE